MSIVRCYKEFMAHRKSTTLIEDPAEWMEAILLKLNSDVLIWRETMRRLVNAWESSGRDVGKMLKASKELREELLPYLYGDKGLPSWRALPFPKGSGLQVMLDLSHAGPQRTMTRDELGKDEPRKMFMQFLVNPLRDKLSIGPCARCENYYRKKRANQKVYCGRKCANFTSAEKATRERLAEERKLNLARAQEMIAGWDALKRRPAVSWKKWVGSPSRLPACTVQVMWKGSMRTFHLPPIGPWFLTHAVKHGELHPPTEEAR